MLRSELISKSLKLGYSIILVFQHSAKAIRKNLLLFGFSLFVTLTLHAIIQYQDRDLEFTRSQFKGQFQTPVLIIRKPSRVNAQFHSSLTKGKFPTQSLRALLIHGLSASKSVMVQLGTELARRGIDCYLIDLPGHGDSLQKFSWEFCQQAVQEAIQDLNQNWAPEANSGQVANLRKLIVIGHSLGGGLAIDAATSQREIGAVVAISPTAAVINPSSPKNLLILLGEFDFPFVRKGAEFLFEQSTGMSLPPLNSPGVWKNLDSSRKLIVLPWTEHSLGLFKLRSFDEMAYWLNQIYPQVSSKERVRWTSILLKCSFCISLLFLFIPGFNLYEDLTGVLKQRGSAKRQEEGSPQPRNSQPQRWNRPLLGYSKIPALWSYGISGGFAALLLLTINPWDGLNLMGGGYLSGFFFLTGLLALCLHPPRTDSMKVSWADCVAVIFATLFLILLAAPSVSRNFVHVNLSQARSWRAPLVALSLFPFYLFDEWASRYLIQPTGRVKLLFFHLSSRFVLALILLLAFFILQNGQFLIVLVLPGLLSLSILCWLYAGLVYQRTRSITASALFSALLTGWFFSTFFAQV